MMHLEVVDSVLDTRGDELSHVEVKGTTGGGDTFFLTRNEVELAKRYPSNAALFFVRNIRLRRTDSEPIAEGGEPLVFNPWEIDEGALIPVQYEFRLPNV